MGVGPQKIRFASMGYMYGVQGGGVIRVVTCVGSKNVHTAYRYMTWVTRQGHVPHPHNWILCAQTPHSHSCSCCVWVCICGDRAYALHPESSYTQCISPSSSLCVFVSYHADLSPGPWFHCCSCHVCRGLGLDSHRPIWCDQRALDLDIARVVDTIWIILTSRRLGWSFMQG